MNALPAIDTLRDWARELGFTSLGVADLDLEQAGQGLRHWLAQGFHGEMHYMARHADLREQPQRLVPGTLSALMVTLDYLPVEETTTQPPSALMSAWATLTDPERAYVSRYALGRDYHKLVRSRLQQLASRMEQALGPFGYRVFCDSAPVMEVELARRAGLGWRGKNTLLIEPGRGSFFFIGTLYTDLPLESERKPEPDHCGSCERCMDACPTGAIIGPYRLDARRCISYLTIELQGSIPEPLRPAMGNRIYGCDDCQLVCPWNRFAVSSPLPDFAVRHGLQAASLVELFSWTSEQFEANFAGSAIRRIGHERWLRNIAVALGNALAGRVALSMGPADSRAARGEPLAGRSDAQTLAVLSRSDVDRDPMVTALRARADHPSAMVREHVSWALAQAPAKLSHTGRANSEPSSDKLMR
jgi:epoxyqueuosine reductase